VPLTLLLRFEESYFFINLTESSMSSAGYNINFGDLPDKYSALDAAAIVILPVPYDETSTWIKGADKGPQAILEASANLEIYDIATDSQIYRLGIYTAPAC